MTTLIHLIIESGEDAGKEISISENGARLGRSSKNDIVLVDPKLSRHHCRFYFKDGDGLWIADLGSANETLVNGQSITEVPLRKDNRILVGDTILRVKEDGRPQSTVNLGLGPEILTPPAPRNILAPLVALLIVITAAAIGAFVWKKIQTPPPPVVTETEDAAVQDLTLRVDYEKIEGSVENVFRYRLQITPDRTISIEIDDLINNRTVREEKQVDQQLLDNLAAFTMNSGFLSLDSEYCGVNNRFYNTKEVSITIGAKTHFVRVENHADPDIFQLVCEKLERFGQIELGLWAIQFSTEKLIEMANDGLLQGKKLYSEREIQYGNLFAAIKSLEQAEWYLETVDPKPPFYGDILTTLTECKDELDTRYEEQNFRAVRALQVPDWETAATELRIICELIPRREDERHQEARKKLIEVEARLDMQK